MPMISPTSLLSHQNPSHEFVVTDPNSEPAEQQPQQLLLAIPSYALSEANQANAALPQLNQLQPQLHRQPSAALCPTVMEANIPCLPEYSEDQVLLGEDHHHHLTLDNSNSNVFFATNFETNESYIYEYFQQPYNNNSNDSQTAPICYNLIDGFVDEVRGEMKAEASLPIEFKCTNVFYEVRKWEEEVEESINDHQLQLPSSSSISSSSSSPPIYHYGPPMFLSESPTGYLQSENAASEPPHSSSSSLFYNSSPSETSSSNSDSQHDDNDQHERKKSQSKKYSLFGLTYEEVNERKRQQNKNAARRYREKKQKEFESNKSEISRLERRNIELRNMEKNLGEQIEFYKKLMIERISSSSS
jgi:hypothetical protein